MKFSTIGIVVSVLWLCTTSMALGSEQTERFIPLGQSPGLSGKVTDTGRILAFDAATGTLSVDVQGGPRPVRITDDTRIWLDRSKQRQTNLSGRPADLEQGRLVEVRYVDPNARRAADWVKIELAN
jgi:hypothetical protein